ncbi:MAG: hypothetical protein JXA87_15005 [Thermoleophilia bacterium]|nr:hypothetical protein [Thermoleophilia bacterium]
MSLRLALLRRTFPKRLKLRMLDELREVTAEGLGVEEPRWPGRSFEDRLAAYALFTAREGVLLTAGGDTAATEAAKERLRRGAMRLGASVRQSLGLRRPEEALEAWKLLYCQIGIEVTGDADSGITVTRCFFAGYYSEPVCGVIEALDDGMAEGLFGGAKLAFSERLTAGQTCCRAVLRLEERGA